MVLANMATLLYSGNPTHFLPRKVFGWFLPYQQHPTFPVILDTGATITITPDHTDFGSEYTPSEGDVLRALQLASKLKALGLSSGPFTLILAWSWN